LAKSVVDVAWWLALAGSAVILAMVLFWPLTTREGLDPTVHVQVSIPDDVARRLLSGFGTPTSGRVEVEDLEDLKGSLELRPLGWWMVLLGGLAAVPGIAAGLLGLHLLRSFLRDVLAAEVFTAANARRLSSLGWLMVIAGVALPLIEFGYSLFLVRNAGIPDLPGGVGIRKFDLIVPGLLVLVVAAAWRYGVELRRDHDLTV
jgi:hypothetical protein